MFRDEMACQWMNAHAPERTKQQIEERFESPEMENADIGHDDKQPIEDLIAVG